MDTLWIQKTSKNEEDKFICDKCNYKCCNKYNLDRHFLHINSCSSFLLVDVSIMYPYIIILKYFKFYKINYKNFTITILKNFFQR